MTELAHQSDVSAEHRAVLREDDPIVSMDIALGKTYDEVDFDYDAFRDEAERLGMSPQDIGGMSVRLKQPRLLDTKGGFYDVNGDKGIIVNANHKVNRRISHELKHKADDVNGRLKKDTKYKAGRFSAIMADKLVGLGAAGGVAAVAGSEIAEKVIASPYYLTVLGGTALMSAGYFLHPAETRARKAARSSHHEIVTLSRR